MIRLTWRQFRAQAFSVGAALVVLAAVALLTGPHLVDLYRTEVAGCSTRGNCNNAIQDFLTTDSALRNWLGILVISVPGLIGAFWGATLVSRELETGTFRMVWTQSVTRTRWLVSKLAVIGLASALTAGLVSLIVTWWASPLDRAGQDRFSNFDFRGIVPIGHALFAFVLGVAAGTMIRRLLPAMAATVVGFIAIRLLVTSFIRPHLFAPLHRVVALDRGGIGFGSSNGAPMTLMGAPPQLPNAWVYSTTIVDSAGRGLPSSVVSKACPRLFDVVGPPGGGPSGAGPSRSRAPQQAVDYLGQCVTKLSATYHKRTTYQPAHRYWPLQWIELGLYLAAAVALAGLCVWWVRRRVV